jgi:hypothetical protein
MKHIFLGIKQYGYYYHDKNNQIIEKSVFAGVPPTGPTERFAII